MLEYKDLTLRPIKGRKYKLLVAVTFMSWQIPQGYKTNGANVPRPFWWLIEPNQSDLMPAIITHDFLCDIADGTIEATILIGPYCNFKQADKILREHLIYLKQPRWKVWLMYTSVRVYHWVRYERKWLNKRYRERYSKC